MELLGINTFFRCVLLGNRNFTIVFWSVCMFVCYSFYPSIREELIGHFWMNRCAFCNLFSALSHKSFGVISQLACFFNFRFASSSFGLQSIGDLVVWGVGRKSACEMGIGLRFGSWDAGAASTARWGEKHSAQRFTMALRAVSLQFVRLYAFSRLRRESPRVLLRVMRICEVYRRFPFLIACKWR